jgi:excinuclease ABC subunit A
LALLTVVTGVSGSGKSTLVQDILYRALAKELYGSLAEPGAHQAIDGLEHLDKVIEIDQSPIGRTPRSNPATYTGLFTPIRELYAMLPESRERGYKPGRFSFNVKGGRCEACEGEGLKRIEMNFLPDVYVLCDVCRGARYNRETLSVKYKGKSIAELLDTTVEEALPVLENVPQIKQKLQTLLDVGLGLHQAWPVSHHLVGRRGAAHQAGEGAVETRDGRTVYILDEPTTGLALRRRSQAAGCAAKRSSVSATLSSSSSTIWTSSRARTSSSILDRKAARTADVWSPAELRKT